MLNVGGYIGDSTRSEIRYAEQHGKPVCYLMPDTSCPDCGVIVGELHTLMCGARDSGQEIWPASEVEPEPGFPVIAGAQIDAEVAADVRRLAE